ncbi:MAG: Kelch repeat-containing protein, partial [Terriglobales bacterium]
MLNQFALVLFLAATALAQTFIATGSMAQARAQAAATLLPNGEVLVAGGNAAGASLRSAALFDPATENFQSAGNMLVARTEAQSVRLANGKIWIVGGDLPFGGASTTEFYDPTSRSFAAGPMLPEPLTLPKLVSLSNGEVLIFGDPRCTPPACTSPVFKFDPASNQISADGQLQIARGNFSIALLSTGKVLVISGWSSNAVGATSPTSNYELYDPASGQSVLKATPQFGAFNAAALSLPGGKVLFCGGGDHFTGFETGCYLYDPGMDSWQATGNMQAGRNNFAMVLLPDGRVLVAGGTNAQAPDAEMYDPSLGTFASAGNFLVERGDFSTSRLSDGRVLFAGGHAPPHGNNNPGPALASAELF